MVCGVSSPPLRYRASGSDSFNPMSIASLYSDGDQNRAGNGDGGMRHPPLGSIILHRTGMAFVDFEEEKVEDRPSDSAATAGENSLYA